MFYNHSISFSFYFFRNSACLKVSVKDLRINLSKYIIDLYAIISFINISYALNLQWPPPQVSTNKSTLLRELFFFIYGDQTLEITFWKSSTKKFSFLNLIPPFFSSPCPVIIITLFNKSLFYFVKNLVILLIKFFFWKYLSQCKTSISFSVWEAFPINSPHALYIFGRICSSLLMSPEIIINKISLLSIISDLTTSFLVVLLYGTLYFGWSV